MANKDRTFPAEVYSRQTVDKLLKAFGKSATDMRNKALIMVYWRCQLRCNEALDLMTSDIDWDRQAITIRRGKGGKRRVVGVDRETLVIIKAWLTARRVDSDYVFSTHQGHRMDSSYVRRMAKRMAGKVGIRQRVHIHGFRHTGACNLADSGLDLRLIQRQLGHSSLAVTDRYLDHIGAGRVVDEVSRIEW